MSTPTMDAQNKAALDHFVQLPVSRDMVKYLAEKASSVIQCELALVNPTSASRGGEDNNGSNNKHLPPTPPTTPPPAEDANLPSVEAFITSLIRHSHVQVYTLMPALVYLARLKERLPPVAKGMRCTVHRIFLASLILAAKYLNDSSPKNKYWARYTNVPGFDRFGFSTSEVNLMEKQMLYLLDWDLRISNEDLYLHLEPFLAPIRTMQAQRAEKAMQAMLRERAVKEQLQQQLRSARATYESPRSVSSSRSSSVDRVTRQTPAVTRHRPYQSVASLSAHQHYHHHHRAPSRTPSLSPPSRSDTASSYANSVASRSPYSPMNDPTSEHSYPYSHSPAVHIRAVEDGELASVVQLPPPPPPAKSSAVWIEPSSGYTLSSSTSATVAVAGEEHLLKPAKKLKTSAGGIFSKGWWSAAAGYAPRHPQLSNTSAVVSGGGFTYSTATAV